MGVFANALSYVRMRVSGEHFQQADRFEQALSIRRFRPLKAEGDDNESSGFALAESPFDDDVVLESEDFLFGDRLLLAFREDTIVIPKQQLTELVKKRLADHQEKTGREASNALRKTIEMAVKRELRSRVFPSSKVAVFAWDFSRKEVRFFNKSKGFIERFTKSFEHAFEVKLFPHTFANMALNAEMQPREKAQLQMLRPLEIFPTRHRVELE